ncbi:hypothetical protein [Tichowtungia aerotolerans]|uniref:Uncharacterized protein n=1 Tax=Tichowtungia aerotolerans TaxID=2697043 RepID=A0A6P1MEM8_9BACT|nr:hypothetical protein [Tichowtungia aerotolerans]QHI70066.1 hypothetical protein GT409_11625 [Tichowtungia aerotolerans]
MALVLLTGMLAFFLLPDRSSDPEHSPASSETECVTPAFSTPLPLQETAEEDKKKNQEDRLFSAMQAIIDTDDINAEYQLHLLIQKMSPNDIPIYLKAVNRIEDFRYRRRGLIAVHYRWIDFDADESMNYALASWDTNLRDDWFDVLVRRSAELAPSQTIDWLAQSKEAFVLEAYDRLIAAAITGMAESDLKLSGEMLECITDHETRFGAAAAIAGQLPEEEALEWRDSLPSNDLREVVTFSILARKTDENPAEALNELAANHSRDPRYQDLVVSGLQKLIEKNLESAYGYFESFVFTENEFTPLIFSLYHQLYSENPAAIKAWLTEIDQMGMLSENAREYLSRQLEPTDPEFANTLRGNP